MEVEFSNDKTCQAFQEFVIDSSNRRAHRKITSLLNPNVIKALVKLYQKIQSSPNALHFNQTNSGNNRIEITTGIANKDNIVLKVRVQDGYRKFFHFYKLGGDEFCLQEDWKGQFAEICKIHVFAVNKHDYSVI